MKRVTIYTNENGTSPEALITDVLVLELAEDWVHVTVNGGAVYHYPVVNVMTVIEEEVDETSYFPSGMPVSDVVSKDWEPSTEYEGPS